MDPSIPSPYGPPQSPYGQPQAPGKKKTPDWLIILAVLGVGGIVLVGTLAALAIFGVRRFLVASKTSEAKNTIGAIARGARASYEREPFAEGSETASHALCKSAIAVPSFVPAGVKYQPATSADFDTGDRDTGWKCLRFSMTQPFYYQYHYQQGAGYLAAAASPGPDGYEAAARGDLDGDGDTSLFSVTGRVTSGTVVQSTSVHVENESE